MRLWLSLCAVAALAACCSTPVNPHVVDALRSSYAIAVGNEDAACAAQVNCDAIRTARYNAAAAMTSLASNPSSCTLRDARAAVAAYLASEQ